MSTRRFYILVIILAILSTGVFAQSFTGSISGLVTDSSKSAVVAPLVASRMMPLS